MSGDPQCRDERRAAALAAQIELSLRESAVEVEGLAAALARMSARLGEARNRTGASPQLASDCRQIGEDLNTCMVHLQFYDRMAQHLTHLRDFLLGVAGHDNVSEQQVLQRLRQRLVSDTQRELLDLLLPSAQAAGPARGARRSAVPADDIELF